MDKNKRILILLLSMAGTMGLLVALDLFSDYSGGGSLKHLIVESVMLCVSVATFVILLRKLMQIRIENRDLFTRVQVLSVEKDKWKCEAGDLVKGLSQKIEDQFCLWNLTHAETEVGFLLLKGFALKEIAAIRGTQLKTVQQQAQSIYHKTKISNRSEFSAFFLEDLLPPLGESPLPDA